MTKQEIEELQQQVKDLQEKLNQHHAMLSYSTCDLCEGDTGISEAHRLQQENKEMKYLLDCMQWLAKDVNGEVEFRCWLCKRELHEGHADDCRFNNKYMK